MTREKQLRDKKMIQHTLTKSDILRIKIELLCYGAQTSSDIEKGRKVGAGPAGGRVVILPGGLQVNTALWGSFTELSPWKLRTSGDQYFLSKEGTETFRIIPVDVVPRPSFYSKETSDGVPMWKIALLHGTDCLATTICQKCVHWSLGRQCKFCGTELSLRSGSTIPFKTPKQVVEVVGAASEDGVCNHITLTTGTPASPDRGSKYLANIVRNVKEHHRIPIHVQVEPPKTNAYLDMLADSRADTVGIHIESFDQRIFEEACPGKAKTKVKRYFEAWKYSVELFGENQVSSFIIAGLGESDESILTGAEELARIGVVPYLVPFRPIAGTAFEDRFPPNINRMVLLYQRLDKILETYGVYPSKNKAGCVRCGACSVIQESQLVR